jgi:hypothetical protein
MMIHIPYIAEFIHTLTADDRYGERRSDTIDRRTLVPMPSVITRVTEFEKIAPSTQNDTGMNLFLRGAPAGLSFTRLAAEAAILHVRRKL